MSPSEPASPAVEPARGVVVAHGEMARGMVDAVRQIAGSPPGALAVVPNRGTSREDLSAKTRAALSGARNVIFTDLSSGRCHRAALDVARDHPGVTVVTGVNLPMLLDFVFNRRLGFDELVPRLAEKGRTAIAGQGPFAPRPAPAAEPPP